MCDDHISLYQLTLERGTPFYRDVKAGKMASILNKSNTSKLTHCLPDVLFCRVTKVLCHACTVFVILFAVTS